jgi:hypothetical protein
MRPLRLLIVIATLLALIGQGLPAGATNLDCSTQRRFDAQASNARASSTQAPNAQAPSAQAPDCCHGTAAANQCHSSGSQGSHHGGSPCKSSTGCQLPFSTAITASDQFILARDSQRIEATLLLHPASRNSADQWRPPRLI